MPPIGTHRSESVRSLQQERPASVERRIDTPASRRCVQAARKVCVSMLMLAFWKLAAASVLIIPDAGQAWDPLVGSRPILNERDDLTYTGLSLISIPAAGPVQLSARCCLDAVSRTPVLPANLSVDVKPHANCVPAGRRQNRLLPPCAAGRGTTVNLAPPGAAGRAFLHVRTTGAQAPAQFIATIEARSGETLIASQEVYVNVVAWPPDGPVTTCFPGAIVVPLAQFNPFAWKRRSDANLARTTLAIGVAVPPTSLGFELDLLGFGGTGPVPRNVTTLTVTNLTRNTLTVSQVDSFACAASRPSVDVPPDEARLMTFNSASVTTLRFDDGTNAFVLSQGPFWTLFGGRRVAIQMLGP